jgi:hypothetical protein
MPPFVFIVIIASSFYDIPIANGYLKLALDGLGFPTKVFNFEPPDVPGPQP